MVRQWLDVRAIFGAAFGWQFVVSSCRKTLSRLALNAALVVLWSVSLPCNSSEKQPITVADMIGFTVVGDPGEGYEAGNDHIGYDITQWANHHHSEFSPDGSRAAVIVRHGNISSNQTEASILVFSAAELFSSHVPQVVASFASTSNRPPIQTVRWLADNRSLVFIGERPEQLPQVFTVDVITREIEQITHSQEGVKAFDITPKGDRIVFLAATPTNPAKDLDNRRSGFFVTGNSLIDSITGTVQSSFAQQNSRLYVEDLPNGRARAISDPRQVGLAGIAGPPEFEIGRCTPIGSAVSISPDGKFALRSCSIIRAPQRWMRFENANASGGAYLNRAFNLALARAIEADHADPLQNTSMSVAYLQQHIAFDLDRDVAYLAVDAPVVTSVQAMVRPRAWLPGGHVAILAGTLRPAGSAGKVTSSDTTCASVVAQVDLVTGDFHTIAPEGDKVSAVRWDFAQRGLSVDDSVGISATNVTATQLFRSPALYRPTESRGWQLVKGRTGIGPNSNGAVQLSLEETANDPPILVAQDLRLKKRVRVLDPNPWIVNRSLGRLRSMKWSKNGATWIAGLYYPPNFVSGMRYPLVIQTHGFSPARFSLYGSAPTAFAAQPLAAHGMLVAQVGNMIERALPGSTVPDRLTEARVQVESLIDELDSQGLIDRMRIGIIGWSSSCVGVKGILTYSSYHFAAATIADGYDGGYLEYMTTGAYQANMEAEWGAAPFGSGLDSWHKKVPGFNMEKLSTPLRIEANTPQGLTEQWEYYAGLLRLGKPVDLYYMPDGAHEEIQPAYWQRSAQGAVDWYRFWLKGEEDPAKDNVEQYARWEKMCDTQRAVNPDRRAFCVGAVH
jgi:dipeptidyl aminopeptidase/acylaminoacyl peptidase